MESRLVHGGQFASQIESAVMLNCAVLLSEGTVIHRQ